MKLPSLFLSTLLVASSALACAADSSPEEPEVAFADQDLSSLKRCDLSWKNASPPHTCSDGETCHPTLLNDATGNVDFNEPGSCVSKSKRRKPASNRGSDPRCFNNAGESLCPKPQPPVAPGG